MSLQSFIQDGYINMTGTGGVTFRLGSGYSEQMRLTSTGLGIGTSSPGVKLEVIGSTLISTGGDNWFGYGSNKDNYFTTGTGSGVQIWRNSSGTEFMRLDASGNLGIGTSSPDAILHIAKSNSGGIGGQLVIDNPVADALNNAVEISFLTAAGASGSGIRNARIQAVEQNASTGATNIQFWTYNGSTDAERMRLDASGNLGLGVTPSAWNLGKVIEVGNLGSALWAYAANSTAITSNAIG